MSSRTRTSSSDCSPMSSDASATDSPTAKSANISAPPFPSEGRSPTRANSLRGMSRLPERRTERTEPRSTRRAMALRLSPVNSAASVIVRLRLRATYPLDPKENEHETGGDRDRDQQSQPWQ